MATAPKKPTGPAGTRVQNLKKHPAPIGGGKSYLAKVEKEKAAEALNKKTIALHKAWLKANPQWTVENNKKAPSNLEQFSKFVGGAVKANLALPGTIAKDVTNAGKTVVKGFKKGLK
jgi:hypothetical protein